MLNDKIVKHILRLRYGDLARNDTS